MLDLLAFCTGTLLDGVTGTDGPHAINALSNVLQLDMTRYWTPTRASYFDHVSKARIVDVARQSVSPKIALDLSKMKKGDAAASAELRLAKSAWLPEMLTDREVPVTHVYGVMNDSDENDANNGQETEESDPAEPTDTGSGDPADTANDDTRPAWPSPTTASINSHLATRDAA
ncbi:hypothetical protein OKW45_004385 [Paraburkholderia sp. WSM4175]|uniref:hypothetical protein n=1 Tax=Paraburkholderia sp. WSM4175 TaxID=2991072 RepID=UPI003D1FB423